MDYSQEVIIKPWERIGSLRKCVKRQRIRELRFESQRTFPVRNEPDKEAE